VRPSHDIFSAVEISQGADRGAASVDTAIGHGIVGVVIGVAGPVRSRWSRAGLRRVGTHRSARCCLLGTWCCCGGCRGCVACRVSSRAGVWVCGRVGVWVDTVRSTDFACVGPCGVEWMLGRAGQGEMDTWIR
jgi:hypothetical protein